jgi:hypothetical protein
LPATVNVSLVALLVLTAGSPAMAVNGTWSSSATTGAWQTTTNWLSGIVPGATSGTTNTDTATFNNAGNGQTTIIPDAGRNLENITFDTGAAPYTIGARPRCGFCRVLIGHLGWNRRFPISLH